MTDFNALIKKAGNEFAHQVSQGTDTFQLVDTGSYALNALISGRIFAAGMPNNKVIALAGEESTGKSFYALSIAKNFQTMYPKGVVVCFESEGALDESVQTTEMLEKRGIDTKRFHLLPVVTIQDFRTQCARILDAYMETPEAEREPMLLILDSLGNLSTNKEVADIAEGKDTRDMTRTQLIRGAFRVLTLKMNRARVPMIVTNHTYEVTGAYVPTKEMSGGGGLKYAASIILFLSKGKKRDTDGAVTGALIKVKVDKSRFTREGKEVVTLFDHTKGLDRYYGLLDLAEKLGVIKKVSTKFQFPDGRTAFESVVNRDPEKYFTPDLLKQIDQQVGNIFNYGADEVITDDEETETA